MTNSVAMPIDAERTLEMTRLIRAPKDLVLRMWSDPNVITHWWGPKGFSTTTEHMDFRPGGTWKFTMNAPDGTIYPNFIRYTETGPDRIAFDHSSDGGKGFEFHMEALFEEVEPGWTRMTFRQVHPTAEQLRTLVETYGAKQGMADTLTRLDGLIGDRLAHEDPFHLHISLPSETQVRMVRSFRAPRALVFDALTRAEHLSKWWGPSEFKIVSCETETAVGGNWNLVNEDKEGNVYKVRGTYLEMTPPERFVATFEFEGQPSLSHTYETALEEIDGLTRMTVTSSFKMEAGRDEMLYGGLDTGAGETFDRLETLVLFASDEPRFTISRVFNAPQELVWKAWTEAERLAKWWGPKGCTIRVAHLDVQPGGTFHFAMDSERGTMWGRFVYRDVNPIDRLAFVNSFSDAQGGLTRAPFSDVWPLEVLNVLSFSPEGAGTRLHLEATPLSGSEAELKQFVDWFDSMEQGFGGTFDQLEEHLAEA